MFFKKIGLAVACTAAATLAFGQDCHLTLRGTVIEGDTGEPLAFANIFIKEAKKGAATDEKGQFEVLDLCENTNYTVEVSHIECEHAVQLVRLRENSRLDFRLSHSSVLKEILISEKAVAPRPAQAEVSVAGADLEAARGQNLAEALRKLPGVSVLNTGASIAKPVIQGLHSNRIAIVTNGTTLEGQQWGAEHAPEIDPFSAAKISVVKGAAGVRYGAGAMGGAVIVEAEPLRTADGWGGWVATGGSSNGRGGVLAGAADFKFPARTLAVRLQGTLKRSGNLRAPDYFLGNTGAAEFDFSAAAGWRSGRWRHEVSGFRFQQKLGILRASHTGSTTELDSAIRSDFPLNNDNRFTYKINRPQQRVEHNLLKIKSEKRISEKWKWSLQEAIQYNRRREYDAYKPTGAIENGNPRPQITFNILTATADAAVEHFPIRHWQGAAGVQAMTQYNYVSRGGLIPDFLAAGSSAWLVERWRRYPNAWEFEFGARYDFRWSHVTDTVGSLRKINEKLSFGNPSASAGAIYHFSKQFSATLNSGLAWRPPHVYELFARGVHHGSGTFEQGNPSLRPETGWNSNLTFDFSNEKLVAQAVFYRNQISNFIFLNPDLRQVLTVRGSFPSYSYRQSDAVLAGFDGSFSFSIFKKLSLESRVSLLRGSRAAVDTAGGEQRKFKDWLPLMPADRLGYGLRWTVRPAAKNLGESFLKIFATSTARQIRVPAEGLVKPAPAAATVVSLDGGHFFQVGKRVLELGFSVQNLTNLRYREYLNFFRLYADEAGFNLSLRAKIIF